MNSTKESFAIDARVNDGICASFSFAFEYAEGHIFIECFKVFDGGSHEFIIFVSADDDMEAFFDFVVRL